MARTSDQVKLLFFGLLRTVSALASTEHKVVPFVQGAAAAANAPEITLRLAKRTDVPSIQRCNLATLPENYNSQFYTNHLRQWPDLAIVVECSEPLDNGKQRGRFLKPDQQLYSTFPTANNRHESSNIVAYVIGKVEDHTEMEPLEERLRGGGADWGSATFRTQKLGHVTSLAVLEPYRRRGLAQALMEQLHHHMAATYGVKTVGLHVRQSNTPAEKLYQAFGYEVSERIPDYYQDGEDAYLMQKRLPADAAGAVNGNRITHNNRISSSNPNNNNNSNMRNSVSLFGSLRRPSKPWETGPLRLPRSVGQPKPKEETTAATQPTASGQQEDTPEELLTGTM